MIDYKDIPERTAYIESINQYIDALSAAAVRNRDAYLMQDKSALRRALKGILGFPLTQEPITHAITAKKILLTETESFRAYRYQLEVMPNFWFYGILYESVEKSDDPCALLIAQHGGGGTPEILGGFLMDSANYNHMVARTVRKGVSVFAPQTLSWNVELYGSDGYDREAVNKRLVQLGGSITALEVYCIMRSIDYFAAKDDIDPTRIGMIGLSYGGMFTLMTAALDPRITAAYSSCWFNDRRKHNWYDWVYFNQENIMFDAEIAALILPRRIYLELAERDQAFPAKDAEAELDRLDRIARAQGLRDRLEIKIFDGEHELDKDGAMLERFMCALMKKEAR